jgi:hypothetical protein
MRSWRECWNVTGLNFNLSRPLSGTCLSSIYFPAVETAGYYQPSPAGTGQDDKLWNAF